MKTTGLGVVVVLGMVCAVLLLRWTDTMRPPADPNAIDESLYLNGKTARRISLGFNGLMADWYWMRSLQYVGKKIINVPMPCRRRRGSEGTELAHVSLRSCARTARSVAAGRGP